MPATDTSAKRKVKRGEAAEWTDEERDAMVERSRELKKQSRRAKSADKADGEADVLAKIAAMPPADRVMAERIHALLKEAAPVLRPRTWYGMPAYYKDGKIVCFFQAADKFKARYATFGFDEAANIDEGSMWPTSWALTELTPANEKRLVELVKKAVG